MDEFLNIILSERKQIQKTTNGMSPLQKSKSRQNSERNKKKKKKKKYLPGEGGGID